MLKKQYVAQAPFWLLLNGIFSKLTLMKTSINQCKNPHIFLMEETCWMNRKLLNMVSDIIELVKNSTNEIFEKYDF